MNFLISYETGKDNYTLHFDKGRGDMESISNLTSDDLLKLMNTIGKTLFKGYTIIKKG